MMQLSNPAADESMMQSPMKRPTTLSIRPPEPHNDLMVAYKDQSVPYTVFKEVEVLLNRKKELIGNLDYHNAEMEYINHRLTVYSQRHPQATSIVQNLKRDNVNVCVPAPVIVPGAFNPWHLQPVSHMAQIQMANHGMMVPPQPTSCQLVQRNSFQQGYAHQSAQMHPGQLFHIPYRNPDWLNSQGSSTSSIIENNNYTDMTEVPASNLFGSTLSNGAMKRGLVSEQGANIEPEVKRRNATDFRISSILNR